MKKLAVVVLLSAFSAAPALAENTGSFYMAADFGSANYLNVPGFDNPSVARISGGVYLSPFTALEIGYSSFGDSTGPVSFGYDTISASSFQVAAIAALPVAPQFDLIGKFGLVSNHEDESFSDGTTASHNRSDLLIGFGAQVHLNSQVSVRALYDYYGKFDNYYPPLKASSVSLGVVYNFY